MKADSEYIPTLNQTAYTTNQSFSPTYVTWSYYYNTLPKQDAQRPRSRIRNAALRAHEPLIPHASTSCVSMGLSLPQKNQSYVVISSVHSGSLLTTTPICNHFFYCAHHFWCILCSQVFVNVSITVFIVVFTTVFITSRRAEHNSCTHFPFLLLYPWERSLEPAAFLNHTTKVLENDSGQVGWSFTQRHILALVLVNDHQALC